LVGRPAMNVNMWNHPGRRSESRDPGGNTWELDSVGPDSGYLAPVA